MPQIKMAKDLEVGDTISFVAPPWPHPFKLTVWRVLPNPSGLITIRMTDGQEGIFQRDTLFYVIDS